MDQSNGMYLSSIWMCPFSAHLRTYAANQLLNASNSDSLREETLHKADGIEGLQVVH